MERYEDGQRESHTDRAHRQMHTDKQLEGDRDRDT